MTEAWVPALRLLTASLGTPMGHPGPGRRHACSTSSHLQWTELSLRALVSIMMLRALRVPKATAASCSVSTVDRR